MERTETKEDLRARFRKLAAEMDSIHEQWKEVAERDDLPGETRLIARETELLAEIDKVVKAFKNCITSRRQ
jgi:hypothetical protein